MLTVPAVRNTPYTRDEHKKLTPVQHQIIKEIARAFALLGAARDLSSALNAWGEIVPESDVLYLLKEANDAIEDRAVSSRYVYL
jgi:hypothetical protein